MEKEQMPFTPCPKCGNNTLIYIGTGREVDVECWNCHYRDRMRNPKGETPIEDPDLFTTFPD